MPNFTTGDLGKDSERAKPPVSGKETYTPIREIVRITNRAEKGNLKSKPVLLRHNGAFYPEEAIPEDESTWLQPGESIDVNKQVILGLFGNIMFHDVRADGRPVFPKDAAEDVIRRFGSWTYNGPPETGYQSASNIRLHIVGPPKFLPDLVLQQIDSRGKDYGKAVAIFDVLTLGTTIQKKLPGTLND